MREIKNTYQPINKTDSIEINRLQGFYKLGSSMNTSQKIMNCNFWFLTWEHFEELIYRCNSSKSLLTLHSTLCLFHLLNFLPFPLACLHSSFSVMAPRAFYHSLLSMGLFFLPTMRYQLRREASSAISPSHYSSMWTKRQPRLVALRSMGLHTMHLAPFNATCIASPSTNMTAIALL